MSGSKLGVIRRHLADSGDMSVTQGEKRYWPLVSKSQRGMLLNIPNARNSYPPPPT